jgi:hypothetical protein
MNTRKIMLLTSVALFARAFDNKSGWKLDADGKIEMKDGNPIWIDSSGNEQTVQGDTITRLNGEAKTHREAKEAAQAELAKYKDIDPDAARKAIDTVGKLDAKKLIDAGEVDRVKEQIKGEFTAQLTEAQKALQDRQAAYDDLLIDNVFSGSEFVRENIAVPQDMFKATFKGHFKVEDGKPVAYDRSGNKLLSKERQGEYANPEEAMRLIVESHPQKDAILRAQSTGGTGGGGGGGGRGMGRTIKRDEYEQLPPNKRQEIALKGEIAIVD